MTEASDLRIVKTIDGIRKVEICMSVTNGEIWRDYKHFILHKSLGKCPECDCVGTLSNFQNQYKILSNLIVTCPSCRYRSTLDKFKQEIKK